MEPVDRFCPNCGHSVAVQPSPAPLASPGSVAQQPVTTGAASLTPPRAKRRRIGLMVGGGCLTLLLCTAVFVGLILLLTGGATDAARKHLERLIRGDVATAYQKASPAFRATISLDAYQALVQARPLLQQTKEISIPDRKVENDIATVTAQLTDQGGVLRSVPMRLRKEGGEWLVIAIDLGGIPAQAAPPAPIGSANPPPPPQPTAPESKEPGIGTVVFGSGRDEAGALIKPGEPVSQTTDTMSADIALLNHPAGGGVMLWIEHIASGRKTAPVSATIEGEGSGNLPFDLHLSEEKLTPGKYRLVIVLGEDSKFVREFEVK